MRGWKKTVLITFLIAVAIIFISLTWYKYTYSMKVATPFEVHSPGSPHHLLIATQGSTFKDAVVKGLVHHFEQEPVYIKVIDIGDLDKINLEEWNAVVILHTWENWKPPRVIHEFFSKKPLLGKIVVLTTSGRGNYKMLGIDAITSPSMVEEVPPKTDEIIRKVDYLFDDDSIASPRQP